MWRRVHPDFLSTSGRRRTPGDVLAPAAPLITGRFDPRRHIAVADAAMAEMSAGGHVIGVCLRRLRQQRVGRERSDAQLRTGCVVQFDQLRVPRGAGEVARLGVGSERGRTEY